ncbi:MAG: ATP-binding cassette domain-containing protein [Alphaproteobacteria bacterium]
MTDGVPRLEVRSLVKRFGGATAVDGVDLRMAAGEVVGLIGPNGCGKSTLLNLIMRVLQPTSGKVLIDGVATSRMATHQIARLGAHYGFQRTRLLPEVSVVAHIEMALAEHGLARSLAARRWVDRTGRERAAEVLKSLGIEALSGQRASELSYGQRQLLCLAMASVRKAKIVLLDEPLAGLSGESIERFGNHVRGFARDGAAVMIVEHRIKSLAAICPRFIVMNEGRIIADGAPRDVIERPQVVSAYFGRRA